jgi:hypothetical protein
LIRLATDETDKLLSLKQNSAYENENHKMQNPPLPADFAFLCYLKHLEGVQMPEHKVGDRLLYSAQFNNPGQWAPDDKIPSTIINVCSARHPIYRIELDMVWGNRVQPHTQGKKIIVGNVWGDRRITPLLDLAEKFF